MKHYVLGFCFDPLGEKVVLLRKRTPSWMMNRYNGVGGKVEENESPAAAMEREFGEEVGLSTDESDWQPVCILTGEIWQVNVFAMYCSSYIDAETQYDEPAAGEEVVICDVAKLPEACLPNVRWLIPMALSLVRGETCGGFMVQEVAR